MVQSIESKVRKLCVTQGFTLGVKGLASNKLESYNLREEQGIPSVNTTRYGLHYLRHFGRKLWNSISIVVIDNGC